MTASAENIQSPDDLGVDELRLEALRPIAGWTMLCGFLALIFLFDQHRVVTWLPPIALALSGYLAPRLIRVGTVAMSAFLVVAWWLILTGTILLFPRVPLAPLYGLIVLPATLLLWPWVGAVAAAASVAVLVEIERASPELLSLDALAVSVFLVFGATILARFLATPRTTALSWAWVAYAQAEEKMTEARERQFELGRVTKSLNETLTTLEDLNRQLVEARAIAVEARKMKAEFAAAVSHELRTPLNLVIGFAEMLVLPHQSKTAEILPPGFRKQVQAIYRNACHIANLVDDILDLSQVDAHRLALRKEPMLLSQIVDDAVAVVVDLVEDEGLFLRTDVPRDLPRIHADGMRIRQILINLLTNASRFTDQGGITVQAKSDGHQVIVAVSDSGLGIRGDDLAYVFDEFRQFGDSRRGGSGLGLSICKRLIELHGGNMWVESIVGRGSTFFFSLPLIEAITVVSESPSLQRNLAVIANRRVQPLVAVIDRDGISKVIGRYLDNYQVERVASVDQAKQLMAAGRVSALLFCSSEDADSWKQVPCDEASLHPVAYCPLRKTTNAPTDLGADGYLVKPVTSAQLKTALRKLGRRWRLVGIVEDQPDMAELIAQMIGSIRPSAQTWRAADGRSALDLLRERRPDVLLLDLLMPHLNGYELLHELRRDERLRHVPVVIITGAEDRDERIVADMVGITRPGGMTVGEAMACLKRGLDSLLVRTPGTDRES